MDATSAEFLQESLRPPVPIVPRLFNPYQSMQEGFGVANQNDTAALNAQKLALGQEQINLLPQNKKFNGALQNAQVQLAQAQADQASAHAQYFGQKATQVGTPFVPPAFNPGSYTPAAGTTSDPADLPVPDNAPLQPATQAAADPGTDSDGTDSDGTAQSPYFGMQTGNADAPDAGNSIVAKATGYFPTNPGDPNYKMEGGHLDAQGNPINTLDAYRRGEAPYVTAAIDKSSPLFGTTAYSTDLGAPVKFSDTGGAFKGKGNSRVDIARDSAAGANADENNGPLTFTLNGSAPAPTASTDSPAVADAPSVPFPGADPDVPTFDMTAPLAVVSGAEDPNTATVIQPGQAIAPSVTSTPSSPGGGIRVPQSQGEADWLRQNANSYLSQVAAAPGGNTPRAQAYAKAFDAEVQHAVAQFQHNRQFNRAQQAAAARGQAKPTPGADAMSAVDPGTGLPVIPGFVPSGIKVANGKLNYEQLSPNDVQNEKDQANQAALTRLNQSVARDTHGGTIDDLLNDRGNYQDASRPNLPGKVTPGIRYFMQSVEQPDPDNPGGKKMALVQTPMNEGQYLRYRQQMAALGVGDDPTKPQGSSVPPQPVLAPNANLARGAQALGSSSITDLSDIPGSQPAIPVIPAQAKLAAAASQITPSTDAEREAQQFLDAQNAQAAQAAASARATPPVKTKQSVMAQQINAAQKEYDNLANAVPSALYPTGPTTESTRQANAASALQRRREAQVKLQAAQDASNYALGPDGTWQYADPFRANSLPTGQTQTAAGATTTRSLNP